MPHTFGCMYMCVCVWTVLYHGGVDDAGGKGAAAGGDAAQVAEQVEFGARRGALGAVGRLQGGAPLLQARGPLLRTQRHQPLSCTNTPTVSSAQHSLSEQPGNMWMCYLHVFVMFYCLALVFNVCMLRLHLSMLEHKASSSRILREHSSLSVHPQRHKC